MAEFKNPNQQGGQDNRSLLVMMLVMVAVFFGLQFLRAKKNPQTASPNANAPAVQTAAGVPQPSPAMLAGAGSTPAAGPAPNGAPAKPTVQAAAEATTVVENVIRYS